MKDKDIERMWLRYRPVTPWSQLSQRAKDAFAALCRACERHGVERAKAFMVPVAERFGGFNWSALDAEIEEENEGG